MTLVSGRFYCLGIQPIQQLLDRPTVCRRQLFQHVLLPFTGQDFAQDAAQRSNIGGKTFVGGQLLGKVPQPLPEHYLAGTGFSHLFNQLLKGDFFPLFLVILRVGQGSLDLG
jgi:hypothetical protein